MSQRLKRVVAPDGQEWRVRVSLFRWPGPPSDNTARILSHVSAIPYAGLLVSVGRALVVPVAEATLGRRPWIEASTEHPPMTMVWRATGRAAASVAVDEITDALRRGEERPVPLAARWVGYDRGWYRSRRPI